LPATPNREHGEMLLPDGLIFEPTATPPTVAGGVRFNGTSFEFKDTAGTYDPRSGSGLSEAQHTALDTLTHEIAENSDTVVTRSSGQVVSVVVWTDSGHTQKIRETLITRSSGQVSVVVTKQYDGAGALLNTYTKTITRSSGQVASIAGVLT